MFKITWTDDQILLWLIRFFLVTTLITFMDFSATLYFLEIFDVGYFTQIFVQLFVVYIGKRTQQDIALMEDSLIQRLKSIENRIA